jgi:hypothetical protein
MWTRTAWWWVIPSFLPACTGSVTLARFPLARHCSPLHRARSMTASDARRNLTTCSSSPRIMVWVSCWRTRRPRTSWTPERTSATARICQRSLSELHHCLASWVPLINPGLSERISLPRSDCTSRKHILAPQELHHPTTPMYPLAFFGGFSGWAPFVGRAWIVLDRRSFDKSARRRRERTVMLHVSACPP